MSIKPKLNRFDLSVIVISLVIGMGILKQAIPGYFLEPGYLAE